MHAYKDIKLQLRAGALESELCHKDTRIVDGGVLHPLGHWPQNFKSLLGHNFVPLKKRWKIHMLLNAHEAARSFPSLNQVLIILACVELLHQEVNWALEVTLLDPHTCILKIGLRSFNPFVRNN